MFSVPLLLSWLIAHVSLDGTECRSVGVSGEAGGREWAAMSSVEGRGPASVYCG